MGNYRIVFCIAFLNIWSLSVSFGQPWNLVKDKDGIRIYTRIEASNSLKSFKGETVFHASTEKVCLLLGNDMNDDWWDKNVIEKKVLAYQENKFIEHYMIYSMPWPLTNRDIVAVTIMATDPVTGDKTFTADPLLNTVPENPNLVRISRYHQKWTIQSLGKGDVCVILEGFIDPSGNIPDWVYNMIVPETPFKAIRLLRERVLSNIPAKY